ncbi:MAG: hypothetical protein ACREDV_09565 [Methylocella sp.]
MALAFASAASAALAASAPAPPPKLDAARKALAAAVKAHDLQAIVALSRFPLAFSGYEAPDRITEAQFLSDKVQFSSLFYDGGAQIVTCLSTGKLEYQTGKSHFPGSRWYIDCDGNEYYFGLAGSKWRFTSYMNVNE